MKRLLSNLRPGDALEWIAAVALVAAAFLWLGFPLALLAAALCLIYFAQVADGIPPRLPKPPKGND